MKNNTLLRIVLLLCLLGTTAFSYAEPDPNFHIYICWGQSNMEGNAQIPSGDKTGVDERFQMLFSADGCNDGSNRKLGQWYTANPPLARCLGNSGFGPVDYFGRTLVKELDPAIRVGVIVVAVGGADIQLFEKDKYQQYLNGLSPNDQWLKDYAKEYGSNPYGRIIDLAKQAQKEGVIKGILVHQGETNSGQSNWPNRLKGVYENMLNDLGLKASEVPLLVGEVRHTGPCSGHNNVIKTVPNTIPTAHVISADGCAAAGDQYHFSADGYKLLGQRYAETMLKLLGDNPVQQSDISISVVATQESEPGKAEITVNVENSSINSVDIYADDEVIAKGQTYFEWEYIEEGTHSIWAVGKDNSGKEYSTRKVTIKIMEEQKPFNGTPFKIPGKIEAEEFDLGGEGNAYHDNDEENRNGTTRNEGVDMSATAIGYTEIGEWLEYTVEVEEDGEYIVESSVASGNSDAQFTLYMDNKFIIPGADGTPGGFIDVPNTGDWKTFQTVTTKLQKISKGKHILKLEITGNYVDIDYLNFKKASDAGNTEEQGTGGQGTGEQGSSTQQEELLTGVTTGKYVDIYVQNRQVAVYAPNGAHTNRPLMISCHGRDQDINYQRDLTQWETVADTADFIVAYPAAIMRGSNVDWDINGNDDVDFIQEVIQEIYKKYKVDLTRVYLSGFSMGGMFTYHCMNQIPDVFAAFAPISGYMGTDVNQNARPLPLIHTHGTSDGVVSFSANGMWAGAEARVKTWADHNKATEKTSYTVESATVTKFSGGECDADCILAAVPGRDHEPTNRSYHTSREIWRFCSQYTTSCGKSNPTVSISVKEISNNDPGEVIVTATILDENIKSIDIYLDGKKVGDGSKEVTLTDLSEGSHTITATGYDNNGKEYTGPKKTINIYGPQTPFNGTPVSLPGTIEAEEFDLGGEGNAYHDNDEENQNADENTKRNEGVDMNATAVGYTQTGEWVEYTVNVEKSGTYSFEAKVASGTDGSSFTLYMDNENIIPGEKSISVPNTGTWEDFTTVKSDLNKLKKGKHILKLEITGDYLDIDNMTFNLVEADDETGLDDLSTDSFISDGIYKAFDLTGRFVRMVNVYNGQCDELESGFFILISSNGQSFPMLIGK